MKMKYIYRFFSALAFCLVVSACGLEEPFQISQDQGAVIEFVPRALGFNNQTVETKSVADDFEKAIHNCFFLLFDNESGNILNTPVNLVEGTATTLPTQLVKLDKVNATSVTACFIANVPVDFVSNIIGLNRPEGVENNEANNNKYLNTAVLSGITYGTGDDFGKPFIDLDGATGTSAAVACIPMFGKNEITLPSSTQKIQIPLKRLFAKVSMELKVDLDDLGALNYLRDSYYNINTCTVNNLPKVVSLVPPTNNDDYESDWVDVNTTQTQYADYFTSSAAAYQNTNVYNDDASNSSKSFSCVVYVPEYYLKPLSSQDYYALNSDNNRPEGSYGNQRYKPMAYSPSKSPIYLTLSGIYKQLSGDTNLKYNIYLGEDATTNFTHRRNVHYSNTLTIRGFNEVDLDHRVSASGNLGLLDVHGEVANCYIISEPKEYSFLAYKGAHKFSELANIADKYKCTKGTSVEVRFKDSDLILPAGSSLSVSDNQEKGVKEITVNVSGIGTIWSGNAIIDLVYTDESGNKQVEWSWHLWFIPEIRIGSNGLTEVRHHVMPDEDQSKMMDRNLGITEVSNVTTKIGAYYKYGQKEPYFNAKNNQAVDEGNSDAYKPYGGGVIQGHTQTWNTDSKSVTDPCPPGYKVPSSSVWAGYTAADEHSNNPSSFKFYDGINYPYSGRMSGNIVETTIPDPIERTHSGEIQYKYELWGRTDRKYRNIVYNVTVNKSIGALWGTDGYLSYEHSDSQGDGVVSQYASTIEPTSADWCKGIWENKGNWLFSDWQLIGWDDWKRFSEMDNTERYTIWQAAIYKMTPKGDVIRELEKDISTILISTSGTVSKTDEDLGYQVRCVKE